MKSNKPWLPTSKKVQDGDSSAGAIFVAEPQHRKLDRGPLNNISFRSQDISNKPSSQRIKEICFHYVYKCSGKYSDSKLAARYVHQMADEILSQLECLDLQINRTEKQPSVLLALLQEFQEAFPSSSESPKKLLEQMKLLKAENDLLKQKMERLEQLHKKELANLSASAKNQLRVYQNGIIKERQFHADRLNEALNQYKSLRGKERKVLEQKHQVIVEDISQQIQTLNQAHEMELKKSDDKTKRLSLLLDQSLETVRLQDEELSLLRQSLQRLEEEDDDDGDGDEEVMMKEQRLLAPANKIDNSPFEKSISLRKVDGVKYAPKKGEVADHSSSEAKKVFVDSETVTDPLLTHSIALQTRELDDTAISIQQSEAQVVQAAVKSRQYIRHAKDLKKVCTYLY